MNRLFLFLSLALALAACATPTPAPTAVPTATPVPSIFDYDATVPFNITVRSEETRDDITIQDITYAAHDTKFSSGVTRALLVRPQGEGPFAGVIYVHWQAGFGQGNGTNTQYLDEAIELSKQGVVCLLPMGYFPWQSVMRGTDYDRAQIIAQVKEFRRAIDFLVAQPGVDAARLGFVGHDYGATYGGILPGVEKRITTYVLIAGPPDFTTFGAFAGFQTAEYEPIVGDLAPIRYVPDAAPASLLFQFGRNDGIVAVDLAQQFFDAASQPKQIEWYEALHDMAGDAIRAARLAWLEEKLGLK